MSAPDRIWITADDPDYRPFVTKGILASPPRTEYIRADLVPQWQPIETAPRDGSMILVCLPRMMNLIVRASYSTVHKYWKTDHETDGGITNPTFFHSGDFWMPLPNHPEDK